MKGQPGPDRDQVLIEDRDPLANAPADRSPVGIDLDGGCPVRSFDLKDGRGEDCAYGDDCDHGKPL